MPPTIPMSAGTVLALLEGFRHAGLDADAIQQACAIPALGEKAFEASAPGEGFGALWREAFRRAPRETLPTEVGLAVPFGAFGPVDYLAGSAARMDLAFESIGTWFRQVATQFRVEVTTTAEGGGLVELALQEPFEGAAVSDEFTIAVFLGRFRAATVAPFQATAVRLTRPAPASPTRHADLLGAPVLFGCAVSALEIPREVWISPMRTADAGLQRTLRALAERLDLGPTTGDLESALRARLRDLLPDGEVSAVAAARALGLTERTLQRRLSEAGTSYREVLDRFREVEAERLLSAGALPLAEVALRLSFSDQTAWNRAFRRWKDVSPTEWLASRRPSGR